MFEKLFQNNISKQKQFKSPSDQLFYWSFVFIFQISIRNIRKLTPTVSII